MIYTTPFSNICNLPSNIEPIAITTTLPEWYRGLRYFHLTPTQYIDLTQRYEEKFQSDVLDKLDINVVMKELNELSCPNEFALIYDNYEHRDLVTNWFKQFGHEVKEYNTNG